MEGRNGFQESHIAEGPSGGNGSFPARPVPFSIRKEPGVLCVEGEIDLATCPILAEALDTAIGETDRDVILDCSGVTFFGAAGVDALLCALDRLQEVQRHLIVRNPPSMLTRVLDIVGVTEMFSEVAEQAPRRRQAG